ncbi:hypothetical protein PVAND_001829 [Polypedilum vanderplanki]|uniref:Uncharacterized protein n=1 Tax=Polypedilum vanderplanki TaxID=319348 RepID=A0A9J6BQG6_POLVA|nr:hypothetical protein PVAND_001829 [Polypedilum vanderplanki]
MDKVKGSRSTEILPDFRKRNISGVFSSWRPKKEENKQNVETKKKSSGSKSIFSTLMLANVEDRLYLDPSGSMESMTFEAQKEKLKSKLHRVKLEKSKIPQIIVTNSNNQKQPNNNKNVVEEEEEEEEIELPKPVSFIVLNVDPYILDIYQDILYNITHQLQSCDDNDEPEIQPEVALNYVRDAFGVNECKHLELMEKIKQREKPEDCVKADSGEIDSSTAPFAVLSPKIKNYESLNAHCDLIKILLKHELETSKTPHYYWMGKFSFLASKILSLHADFQFLDELQVSFAKWIAFVEIHRQYPLHLKVFEDTLDKIVDVYKDEETSTALLPARMSTTLTFIPACFGFTGAIKPGLKIEELKNRTSDHLKIKDDEVIKQFWNSNNLLHESFLKFIHDLHYKHHDEENVIFKAIILKNMFEIVNRIKKIFLPKDIEQLNFEKLLKNALNDGTTEHLKRNMKHRALKKSRNCKVRLDELIRLLKFSEEHMKSIVNEYAHVFESFCKFSFTEYIYSIYDSQLAKIIKPIVIEICSTKEGNIDNFQKDDQTIATKLFELYREIKKFSDQGLEYYYGEHDLQMKDYSRWFTAGIDKWCKVSLFNATSRINKAIEVDNLKPELKESKRSSSAIDMMQILYSVKSFWEKLQWPDANKEAEIAKHVAGDLCRFAIDYFDKFSSKVQKSEAMNITGIFKVPLELSIAVANFEYISEQIQTLIKGMTEGKVEDTSSIEKLINNMLVHLENTIKQLLEITLSKSIETMQKLMLEGAQNNKVGDDIADRLMTYIEDMLSTLVEDLPRKNFEVAKSIIWQQNLQILSEIIQVSLTRQQPPAFFTNLRRILSILKEIFHFSEENADYVMKKKVERIDYLLECYGLNTSRLIHQYFKERYELQLQINKQPFNPYGVLSVYCFFVKNTLKLEILNARNLIPIGPNKKCDSFIKIQLIPEKYFSTFPSYKTKVQQNTHFPLYDEIFEYELTDEQRKIEDAIIFFNIKDKYLLGSNECIAEAFLAFRDIPEYTIKDNLKQIHLTLTRLQCDELESLKALQHRAQTGDKAAKDFLSKLRSRTIISPKKMKLPVTQL